MTAKASFIFIPGAWHLPTIFSPVVTRLSAHGYKSHLLALPSVDANPGKPNFNDDVTAIQSLINERLSAGEEIVIVMWSYGSAPGSEAVLQSMLKSERAKEEKKGGVIHLVFLAAPILPVGMSVEGSRGSVRGSKEGDGTIAEWNDEAGTVTIKKEVIGMMFYNDIEDPELVRSMAAETKPMSVGSLWSELTRAAWTYTPCTAIFGTKDLGLPLQRAEGQLKAAKEIAPGSFQTVERCDTGHVPFVSMPDFVTGVLRRAVGEDD
ncbi:hypothetical protein MMC09_002561 [Bachmanniomyces sp. S44760]|nr:hypothetical protein [Bachmanniomyces sp. S44760]